MNRCWLLPCCLTAILVGCNAPPDTASSPSPTALLPSPTPSPNGGLPTATPAPSSSPALSVSPTVSPSTDKPAEVKTIEGKLGELVSKVATVTIRSVDCPATIEQKAGKTYDCQVDSDAGLFKVTIEPTGQSGQFRWGTKGLLLIAKLNEFIQKNVQNPDGSQVTVDCGRKIRPAKPGDTFECKVTDSKGKVRTTKVTVRDEQGNVDIAPFS